MSDEKDLIYNRLFLKNGSQRHISVFISGADNIGTSWCALTIAHAFNLEKKKVLYKLLPVMFVVTIFLQRGEVEYEQMLNLSYMERYFTYLKYIFTGFIHFFSLYVFVYDDKVTKIFKGLLPPNLNGWGYQPLFLCL